MAITQKEHLHLEKRQILIEKATKVNSIKRKSKQCKNNRNRGYGLTKSYKIVKANVVSKKEKLKT